MTSASSAPATKEDIAMLMEQFGKLYDATERWKNELLEAVDLRIVQSEERVMKNMTLHFDFTVETIRHDLLGVNRDDIDSLKTRVTRLERKAGIR